MQALSLCGAVEVLATLPLATGIGIDRVEVTTSPWLMPRWTGVLDVTHVHVICFDPAHGATLAALLDLPLASERVVRDHQLQAWTGWHTGYHGDGPARITVEACSPLPTTTETDSLDEPADALALVGDGR